MKPFSLLLPLLPLCTLAPLQSAQVGGGMDTSYTVEGFQTGGSLGTAIWTLGDLDGDRVQELGIYGSLFGLGLFQVVSGQSGQTLLYRNGDYYGQYATGLGDIDGDGTDDFAASLFPSTIEIVSGSTFQTIHTINDPDAERWPQGIGDLDGDGIPDLVTGNGQSSFSGDPQSGLVRAFSGADWSVLWNASGGPQEYLGWKGLFAMQDLDGDGVREILATSDKKRGGATVGGYGLVLSGSDGSVLFEILNPGPTASNFGFAGACISDVSGDGVPDILISDPMWSEGPAGMDAGAVFCFSGADGSEIFRVAGTTYSEQFGRSLAFIGDFDGDGWGDFVAGSIAFNSNVGLGIGRLTLFSGKDGTRLSEWRGTQDGEYMGMSAASLHDHFLSPGDPVAFAVGSVYWDQKFAENAGKVQVLAHSPFIRASASSFSVGSGGVLAFQLDFPDSAGGDNYQVLLSATGVGPTPLGWIQVPLSLDTWFLNTYWGNYPSQLGDAVGVLDSKGRAVPFLAAFSSEFSTSLIGQTVWLAAIERNGGSFWRLSSESVPVTFVP